MQQIIFFILCMLLGISLVATALMCYYFDFFSLLKEMRMFRKLDRENLYGKEEKQTGGQKVLLREPGGSVWVATGLTAGTGTEEEKSPDFPDTRLDVLGGSGESERDRYIQFRQKTADLEGEDGEADNSTHLLDDSMVRTTTVSLGSYRSGGRTFRRDTEESHPYTEVLRDERMVCPASVPDSRASEDEVTHTELLGKEDLSDTKTALLAELPEESCTALLEESEPDRSYRHTEFLHDIDPFPHTALLEDGPGNRKEESPGSVDLSDTAALLDAEETSGSTALLDSDDLRSESFDIMTALLELGETGKTRARPRFRNGGVSPEEHTAVLMDRMISESEVRHTELLEDNPASRLDRHPDVRFTELLEESAS